VAAQAQSKGEASNLESIARDAVTPETRDWRPHHIVKPEVRRIRVPAGRSVASMSHFQAYGRQCSTHIVLALAGLLHKVPRPQEVNIRTTGILITQRPLSSTPNAFPSSQVLRHAIQQTKPITYTAEPLPAEAPVDSTPDSQSVVDSASVSPVLLHLHHRQHRRLQIAFAARRPGGT